MHSFDVVGSRSRHEEVGCQEVLRISANHPPVPQHLYRHKDHDRVHHTSRVMRRCSVARQISPVGLWARRSLRTSPRSRPRAVKQLNNAELLQIVQEGRQTAPTPAPESADVLTEEVDELPQESPRLYTHSPLPRSPLEEPRLVAARTRHKAEKPPPSKERSPFQTKLEKNPYGEDAPISPRV